MTGDRSQTNAICVFGLQVLEIQINLICGLALGSLIIAKFIDRRNALLEYFAPKALVRGRSTRFLEELYQHRSKPADMLRSLRWVEIDA